MSVVQEKEIRFPKEDSNVYLKVRAGVWGPVDKETGIVKGVEELDLFFYYLQKQVNAYKEESSTFPSEQPIVELICVWVANQLMEFMDVKGDIFPQFIRVYTRPSCFVELKLSTATS